MSSIMLSTTSSVAHALPDANAPSISLKKDCGTDNNCFTDPGAMMEWIWGARDPSASSPLLVQIDTGTYTSVFSCDNTYPTVNGGRGNVTFRGSGRRNTVLTNPAGTFSVVSVAGCMDLVFQDLTIRSYNRMPGVVPSGLGIGVIWFRGGKSFWNNVLIQATYAAWYDAIDNSGGGCTVPGRHEFYSSRLHTTAASGSSWGYYTACGDSWFWGSEIAAQGNGAGSVNGVRAASTAGKVHIYGSSVRVIGDVTNPANGEMRGLNAVNGGTIHFHGGEIAVRHENPSVGQSVTGAAASGAGSLVHAIDTSFGLLPAGSGTATRLAASSGGSVQAPFRWPSGILAPTPGDASGTKHITSLNGEDSFTETDCGIAGCQSEGANPHLMIYSNSCTGQGASQGPWFDTATQKCRGL
jgi:hypothetical protein